MLSQGEIPTLGSYLGSRGSAGRRAVAAAPMATAAATGPGVPGSPWRAAALPYTGQLSALQGGREETKETEGLLRSQRVKAGLENSSSLFSLLPSLLEPASFLCLPGTQHISGL